MQKRWTARGHLARYSSAIKLIAIDEQNLSLSPNASREKRQARLKEELDISLREIEIMKKLEGESNIAYFQNSQIVPRTGHGAAELGRADLHGKADPAAQASAG